MTKFMKGDRVRSTRDMDYQYFYSHNPGNKAQGVIINKGKEGIVVDTHIMDGKPSYHVCVDFTVTGGGGSWYIRSDDLEYAEE